MVRGGGGAGRCGVVEDGGGWGWGSVVASAAAAAAAVGGMAAELGAEEWVARSWAEEAMVSRRGGCLEGEAGEARAVELGEAGRRTAQEALAAAHHLDLTEAPGAWRRELRRMGEGAEAGAGWRGLGDLRCLAGLRGLADLAGLAEAAGAVAGAGAVPPATCGPPL